MPRPGSLVIALTLVAVACGRSELDPLGEGLGDGSADAYQARCGNGILDPGEACDDGNQDDADACRASCAPARCGDGVVWRGVETCDDGNQDDSDACKSSCGPATCGDGIVQPGEACDDGNRVQEDACLSSCVAAFCGDGYLRPAVEECDDGNQLDSDGCVRGCQKARCGDGLVWVRTEECDDGNGVEDDFCDSACRAPVCGDGRRAGAEQCDLGPDNGDRPAFLISQPSGTRIGTNPIVQAKTSSGFYDYRSASSHTGLEKVGESRIYLYVDSGTGRLSLVTTHGIDFDATRMSQPASRVDMDITGLPAGFRIDLSDDDPREFFASGPSTAAGRWAFNQNSDGGVLGGLPFPGVWKVTVTARFMTGLTTWGWVRDDLQRIPLVMSEPITIEAFDVSTGCRKTCTIPRCGDRILDGGEVCDDGNTVGGDGCAADCKSLK